MDTGVESYKVTKLPPAYPEGSELSSHWNIPRGGVDGSGRKVRHTSTTSRYNDSIGSLKHCTILDAGGSMVVSEDEADAPYWTLEQEEALQIELLKAREQHTPTKQHDDDHRRRVAQGYHQRTRGILSEL